MRKGSCSSFRFNCLWPIFSYQFWNLKCWHALNDISIITINILKAIFLFWKPHNGKPPLFWYLSHRFTSCSVIRRDVRWFWNCLFFFKVKILKQCNIFTRNISFLFFLRLNKTRMSKANIGKSLSDMNLFLKGIEVSSYSHMMKFCGQLDYCKSINVHEVAWHNDEEE